MKNNKKGISLAVLVVTIAILIILVATSISVVLNKRYFSKADYSSFVSNFDTYKDELEDYISNQEFLNNGRYNRESLNANKTEVYYNGSKLENMTIKDIIPTISDYYLDDIQVYNGYLKYVGDNNEFKDKVNVN